jgi:HD-GYP domain-containing protein (c-di-GMP phosphodiesterase class II)
MIGQVAPPRQEDAMPADSSANEYTESHYYLQAVAALARQQTVTAHEDIYCDTGMKLVAKGTALGEEQFQRLARHKLNEPLDNMLVSERAIDAASLSIEAGKILENDPIYTRLGSRSGDPLAIKHGLAALKLPAPLLMRLTVMREQREELFQHSLRTAMIAYALAQRLQTPQAERPSYCWRRYATTSAKCTPTALLASGHAITPEERRYVHVHPLASHMVLNAIKDFPAAGAPPCCSTTNGWTAAATERPRAEQITALAKLLAVADVAETVIRRFDLPRLDMLARLHQHRFDRAAVDALRDLIHATPEDAHHTPPELLEAATKLAHLSDVLRTWFAQRSVFIRW